MISVSSLISDLACTYRTKASIASTIEWVDPSGFPAVDALPSGIAQERNRKAVSGTEAYVDRKASDLITCLDERMSRRVYEFFVRISSVVYLTVFLLVLFTSAAYGQSASRQADDAAVRNLIQQYMDARNSRDAVKVRSLFTEDADQLVSTGEWRRGVDAVVRGAVASSQKEAPRSSIQVEAIRFLQRDLALADGRYQTVSAGSNASRNMWTTLVIKRTHQGWRIAAIRNMLPAPSSAPH
jgi:uncharacterized protein (TIGR02246 family)